MRALLPTTLAILLSNCAASPASEYSTVVAEGYDDCMESYIDEIRGGFLGIGRDIALPDDYTRAEFECRAAAMDVLK